MDTKESIMAKIKSELEAKGFKVLEPVASNRQDEFEKEIDCLLQWLGHDPEMFSMDDRAQINDCFVLDTAEEQEQVLVKASDALKVEITGKMTILEVARAMRVRWANALPTPPPLPDDEFEDEEELKQQE